MRSVRTRARGMWASQGIYIPAGALDRWLEFAQPSVAAAQRGEVLLFADSTGYGSGGLYAWIQRFRARCVAAGLADGGKGMLAGGEDTLIYDAPDVNAFVSTTFGGGFADQFDILGGQFYYDAGAAAGHTLVLQFRTTCFRLWYSQRGSAGDFTYSVDGGAPVTVHANGAAAQKFVYVSGLTANTTHTITITNLAGRPGAAPTISNIGLDVPNSGGPDNGTYYYVATNVFGGGESLPSPAVAKVVDTHRAVGVQVPDIGQDGAKLYRGTNPAGPFDLVTATVGAASGGVRQFIDNFSGAVNSAVHPPVTGTTNLNTSSKGCFIGLAPMNDVGMSVQKYATSGLTMQQFASGAAPLGVTSGWDVVTPFGLVVPAAGLDATDPRIYTVDTSVGAAGRIKPKLALLELGFNDLSNKTSTDMTDVIAGVRKFAALCQASGCSGVVISGQLPYNASWPAYGKAMYLALQDTAISMGLGFVDAFRPIGGPSLAYTGAASNPHLTAIQYALQGDLMFDDVLSKSLPAVAPTNTGAPSITGTLTTGATVTAVPGTWTAFPAPTYTYQWKRNGADITGATNGTYTLVLADEGQSVTVQVTATNPGGSASATSGAVVPAAPFSPATLSPALWLDADQVSGNDGDAIAAWPDSSGHARNAAQATGTKKPILKKGANGIGGHNVLRFDGVDDFMQIANDVIAAAPHGAFFVFKTTELTLTHRVFQNLKYGFADQGGNLNYIVRGVSSVTSEPSGVGSVSGTPYVVGIWASATRQPSFRRNAAAGAPQSAIADSGNALTGNSFIGSTNGTGEFFQGDLAELIIMDRALTGPEQTNLFNYFGAKFSVAV